MSGPGARRGLMLVLSSPSGAGKTSLSRALLAAEGGLAMSVSATTRAPRPGEVDGVDYRYVSSEAFEEMVEGGEFLEWATVFGHLYGTPRAPVLEALAHGRDILFDIDWQGTQQLKQQARDDVVSVFILPPSIADLRERLTMRAQDGEQVIAERMARAHAEISHWAEYDYVLVNDDFDACLAELRTILAAERLRRTRRPGLAGFVRTLLAG
ncbi:MAG: guanylate kinase [Sphingomonadaceae bacterium]